MDALLTFIGYVKLFTFWVWPIVTVLGFVKIVRAIVQEEVKGEKDSQLSVGGAMAIVGLLMMH